MKIEEFKQKLQESVVELLQLVRTGSPDLKMILYQFCQTEKMRKPLRKFFAASYCLPKPLLPKYRHFDIELSNSKLATGVIGMRAGLDVLAGHDTTKQEIEALSKPFGANEGDYMITFSFDCPERMEAAKTALKAIVTVITSLCMANTIAYKILGCFDHKVEIMGSKVVLCIKVKQDYRLLPAAVWDLVRGLVPVEGENDAVHFTWTSSADCEKLATDTTFNGQLLAANSAIHLQADVHLVHFRAILEFIRKLNLPKHYGRALEVNLLFSILETVSGKARLNFSMLEGTEWAKKPARPSEKIAKIRESGQVVKALEKVPVLRKLFEFNREYAQNVQIAAYVPHFSVKLWASLPKLDKLMQALITAPKP
jgi:hypothetical protein